MSLDVIEPFQRRAPYLLITIESAQWIKIIVAIDINCRENRCRSNDRVGVLRRVRCVFRLRIARTVARARPEELFDGHVLLGGLQ